MRPRHWKQVLRFAKGGPVHLLNRGGAFDPNILEELTFGQLLDMGLQREFTKKIFVHCNIKFVREIHHFPLTHRHVPAHCNYLYMLFCLGGCFLYTHVYTFIYKLCAVLHAGNFTH